MSIPSANILGLASRAIAAQTFKYFPYVTRKLLANGFWSSTYAAEQIITGNVQPISRTLYANMGLDYQKSFYNFFIQQSVIDIARDVAGDQFVFEGKNFQCVSKTNWHGIDGWLQVLCVHVPNF